MSSTRLRHIRAKKLEDIEAFVEKLPFKIEHKQTLWDGKAWVIQFTLPDQVDKFRSTDLSGI